MKNNLIENTTTVCRVLNKHAVQYMIVGCAAVTLHGYFRQSTDASGLPTGKDDLDFWYNPTYENYFKLLDALEELGQNVLSFKEEQAPNPKKSFFRYDFDDFTLDLLPVLRSNLNFSSSFRKSAAKNSEGVDIIFMNYDDLLFDKKTNSRHKDKIDIENLEKIKKSEN